MRTSYISVYVRTSGLELQCVRATCAPIEVCPGAYVARTPCSSRFKHAQLSRIMSTKSSRSSKLDGCANTIFRVREKQEKCQLLLGI